MKAILRSINNFSCKLKQSNNLKYNISPKIRSNKYKSISGNGNVTIEDALNKYLKDYRVYGNTYQNSTTGKNLFKASSSNYPQGLTITYNSNTGEISFGGTTTGSYPTLSNFTGANVPPGEYTFSIDKPLLYAIGCRFRNSNGQYPTVVTIPSGELSRTVTVSYNAVRLELVYNVSTTDIQVPQTTIKPMIESGTSATEFEPYTGGHPSPNPDYPQEIVSCGDRTKNLFIVPQTIPNAQRNLATYTKINDNSFSLNYIQNDSTNKAPYVRIDFDITQFKPNTRYTISKKYTVSGDNFSNVGAIRSYINGTNGSVVNSNSFSFTTPSEITSLGVYFYLGYNNTIQGESTITFYDIQVEENSTATPYEPYGYKIPFNVRSENLFDIDTISNIGGGTNNNGIITSTTRSTSGTINLNFKFSDILVKAGETLYFSADIKLNNDSIGTFSTINDNVHAGATKIIYPTLNNKYQRYQTSYTYSNEETVKSMLIQIGNLLGSFEVSNIMISKDDSIIYKPYYNETTNIYLDEPLRKSDDGTYVDHIDFENKKVYRQIREITLNGTEAWSRVSAKNSHYRVNRSDLKIGAECVLYCTHFKNNGDSYSFEGISGSTGHVLYIRWDELFETVDDLKTWLASNTPIVDYVLETPTEESITLLNIKLIEGKNIISIGTEVQGVFEVEYYSKEIIDISDYKYNLRKVED